MENITYTEALIEDFGAIGDGSTDNSTAFVKAMEYAKSFGKPLKILFEKDAVYYVAEGNGALPGVNAAAVTLTQVQDVVFQGENTTLCVSPNNGFFNIISSNNVTIKGFNFENSIHVACIGKLVSVDHTKVSLTVRTEKPLPIDGETYDAYKIGIPDYFAMPDNNFRSHLYIKQFVKTGEENTYKLYASQDLLNRYILRLIDQRQFDIVLPMPGVSHNVVGFHILNCENIHIEDCEFMECGKFVGAIKGNVGSIYFQNVNMRKHPDTHSPICAWRDGYHCKDNRGPIYWKNCIVQDLYDDTFNIASTYLNIRKQMSNTEIEIYCAEGDGTYYDLREGDVFSIYDVYDGKMICKSNVVKKVIKQQGAVIKIETQRPLPTFTLANCKLIFETMCAPGSVIEDCYIAGTVRFRGPITVKNTSFKLLLMWLENECDVEGPIPENIVFENCGFEGEYPVQERFLEQYVSVKTCMKNPGIPEYKCENIQFINCRLEQNDFYIEEGNNVKFVKA